MSKYFTFFIHFTNRGKETMKKILMMMFTMLMGLQSVQAMNVDEFIDKGQDLRQLLLL